MNLTSTGKLLFDPKDRQSRISTSPWWMIVQCCPGIISYYTYWIKKQYGVKLHGLVWGPHVSVIRGEKPKEDYRHLWARHNGKLITFQYSHKIFFNDEYFWLSVTSEELREIRSELGLKPEPFVKFHLTIGKLPPEWRHVNLKNFDGYRKTIYKEA